MLMPNELRAMAPLTSPFVTSSGTIACQVGAISAAPMPPTKVKATSEVTVCRPVADRASRQRLAEARMSWMAIRNFRRSRMSESTPAGIASRKIGKVDAAWMSATAAGAADRSVTSQELATSRTKVPILPMIVATHSTAKTFWRSGANAPARGVSGASAISSSPLSRRSSSGADHTRRPARTHPQVRDARRRSWWPSCVACRMAFPRSAAQ
jgi:hypothetical protein